MKAAMNYNIEGLLKLIPGIKFRWMRQRAQDSWSHWVQAGKYFKNLNQQYHRKKVKNMCATCYCTIKFVKNTSGRQPTDKIKKIILGV